MANAWNAIIACMLVIITSAMITFPKLYLVPIFQHKFKFHMVRFLASLNFSY